MILQFLAGSNLFAWLPGLQHWPGQAKMSFFVNRELIWEKRFQTPWTHCCNEKKDLVSKENSAIGTSLQKWSYREMLIEFPRLRMRVWEPLLASTGGCIIWAWASGHDTAFQLCCCEHCSTFSPFWTGSFVFSYYNPQRKQNMPFSDDWFFSLFRGNCGNHESLPPKTCQINMTIWEVLHSVIFLLPSMNSVLRWRRLSTHLL